VKTKTKKIAFFGGQEDKLRIKAIFAGFQRKGYTIINVRRPNALTLHTIADCDFAVCSLFKQRNESIADYIKKQFNLNTVVVDLGYLKRSKNQFDPAGYCQLSINGVANIWQHPCQSDRFEQLSLPLSPFVEPKSNTILICGQVPNDAQHKMSYVKLDRWLKDMTEFLKTLYGNLCSFVYRPHPMYPKHSFTGEIQNPSLVSSIQALDNVYAILTYNSTMGVEAILKGIPVVCDGSAHYASMANTQESLKKDSQIFFPTDAERLDYFSRVAYSQWTPKELAEGVFIKPLLEELDYVAEK